MSTIFLKYLLWIIFSNKYHYSIVFLLVFAIVRQTQSEVKCYYYAQNKQGEQTGHYHFGNGH